MILLSVVMLYNIKEKTDDLQREKAHLSQKILASQMALRILKVEKDYLSRPSRLEKLSKRYLRLEPVIVSQLVASLDEFQVFEIFPSVHSFKKKIGNDDMAFGNFIVPHFKPEMKFLENGKSLREIFASSSANIEASKLIIKTVLQREQENYISINNNLRKITFKEKLRAKYGDFK